MSRKPDQATGPTSIVTDTDTCSVADMMAFDRPRIMSKARGLLDALPRTVTADIAVRSAGGPNDFFSEGDYWWPVEGESEAPYQRRDGLTNPDNFVAHRLSMMRLSDIVGTLTTAYKMSGDAAYAEAAVKHLRAWFVTPETRMNPHLLYGQAIKGRHTGRSIGIIDTMHLVDVAQAAQALIKAGTISEGEARVIKAWFQDYATWMNTHPYGEKEREHPNNHSIAWSMQIAAFSRLTGDAALMDVAREKFKTWYLPDMMAADGSFPKEIERTKPYSYSIFVYDLMVGIAQAASDERESLWLYRSDNGHDMKLGLDFIYPYAEDKSEWPYPKDVQYWEQPPQRRAFLLFAARAFEDCRYFETAKSLDPDPTHYETVRNMPIRSPFLWMDED